MYCLPILIVYKYCYTNFSSQCPKLKLTNEQLLTTRLYGLYKLNEVKLVLNTVFITTNSTKKKGKRMCKFLVRNKRFLENQSLNVSS